MTYHDDIDNGYDHLMFPALGALDCEACQAHLGDFVRDHLAGRPSEQVDVAQHVGGCASCAWIYPSQLALMSASHVKQLMDGWVEPGQNPGQALPGLLALWQLYVGAAQQVDDANGVARGLSVMGLVRRAMEDRQEARLVHEMALSLAEENGHLLAQMISQADLGYIALSDGEADAALTHLRKACDLALALNDKENEARIRVLLGLARERQGSWALAKQEFAAAVAAATAAEYPFIAGAAAEHERRATAQSVEDVKTLLSRAQQLLLSMVPDEAGQAAQLVREALESLEKPLATATEQLLAALYGLWLEPRRALVYAAAGPPGRAGVQIPMEQVIDGPKVDGDGYVNLIVKMGRAALANLPERFSIVVYLLPEGQFRSRVKVSEISIGPGERLSLQATIGLTVRSKLPGFDEQAIASLRDILAQRGYQFLSVPKEDFSLFVEW